MSLKLPVPPGSYAKLAPEIQRDQQLLREALERNDLDAVHFGRDIELARGERLILRDESGVPFVAGPTAGSADIAARSLVFTPGGDGDVSIYRINASHAQNPRTALISSIASDVITLTTNVADQFFLNGFMDGVSMLRIWNTTKNPDESAWVIAQPAANQLQVLIAASISGWSNGDTIQGGDPTTETPGRVMALDISPMMQNVLGKVFRQSGILLKGTINASAASNSATLSVTANGATGSFNDAARANTFDGSNIGMQATAQCSELSPVSDSNLVFLRETCAVNLSTTLASVVGLWI